jgi:FtsH-binding integral membrane protein
MDAGLRAFMLGVYGRMTLGLVGAGAAAYVTAGVPLVRDQLVQASAGAEGSGLTLTWMGMAVALGPLVALLLGRGALRNPTVPAIARLYWSFIVLMGASLGLLVAHFAGAAVAKALLMAATAFGALSLYGYAARRDLTATGGFLLMGLVGLLAGVALNLFLPSPALHFVITSVGVVVFAGLAASDTQRLKLAYHVLPHDREALNAASYCGALTLFLNFVGLFQFMLLGGEDRA